MRKFGGDEYARSLDRGKALLVCGIRVPECVRLSTLDLCRVRQLCLSRATLKNTHAVGSMGSSCRLSGWGKP